MSSQSIDRERLPALIAQVLVLGIILAGLQAHTVRYDFGSIPIPYTIIFAPIAGFLLSRWMERVWDTIVAAVGTVLVSYAGTVMLLASPVYLVDGISTIESNVVVMSAVSTAVLYTGMGAALLTAGIVVGTVLSKEGFLLGTRLDRPWATPALATVLLVFSLVLAGTVAVNYASTVDQREAMVTVEDLSADGDEVAVTFSVENRLSGALTVESVVTGFSSDGTRETTTRFPRAEVPAGETGEVTITTTCGELEEDGITGEEITIDGSINVAAFNEYDRRIFVDDRTFDNPCAGS